MTLCVCVCVCVCVEVGHCLLVLLLNGERCICLICMWSDCLDHPHCACIVLLVMFTLSALSSLSFLWRDLLWYYYRDCHRHRMNFTIPKRKWTCQKMEETSNKIKIHSLLCNIILILNIRLYCFSAGPLHKIRVCRKLWLSCPVVPCPCWYEYECTVLWCKFCCVQPIECVPHIIF